MTERPTVGVMLTAYKRTQYLAEQIAAIRNQSVEVDEIWVWHNQRNVHPPEFSLDLDVEQIIMANPNLGVWPRFTACLEMSSEFVCIFDDDTLPGSRWLENCLDNFREEPGLYGTVGLVFPPTGRRGARRFGWPKPSPDRHRVDIVGHSWFLKREWLRWFAGIPRPIRIDGSHYRSCGEDYFLSFVLQLNCIDTFVPPHPIDNRELWGSLHPNRGRDEHSLWKQPGAEEEKSEFHHHLRHNCNWRLVRDNVRSR